jgi:hypothetical protein
LVRWSGNDLGLDAARMICMRFYIAARCLVSRECYAAGFKWQYAEVKGTVKMK